MRVVCAQSWPTLCDPTDCSPPGSSVHGILQARILERVAVPFSMGCSQPRDQTRFPYIGRWILYRVTTISCLCPYVPSLVTPLPTSQPLGRHRPPSWAPRAVRQLPTSSFTHGHACVLTLIFQFVPPSLSTTVPSSYPHAHPLELP